MRFAPGSRVAGRMPYRQFGADPQHGRYPRNPHEPGDHDGDHHHHHRMVYWNGGVYPYWYGYGGYPYGYPLFTGYVDPWLFGPDDYDYNEDRSSAYSNGYPGYPGPAYPQGAQDTYGEPQQVYPDDQQSRGSAQQPYGAESYGSAESAPQQPVRPARQPYAGHGQEWSSIESASSSGGLNRPAVTVIFKDGRPSQQIHNYLLTETTLTVFEPQYHEIPLDQVDLAATEAANRAAGVDFRPPGQ